MLRVVGFNGSPNRNGKTAEALRISLGQVQKEGAEAQLVHLADYIDAPFLNTSEQSFSDKIVKLLDIAKSADAAIFATPVHWFNVSGLMKTFIDHLTQLEAGNFALQGMPVACMAVCEEDGGTQACMAVAAMLLHLGCFIVPYGALFKNTSMNGGENNWQNTDIPLLGANVVRMATLTNDCRRIWTCANTKI